MKAFYVAIIISLLSACASHYHRSEFQGNQVEYIIRATKSKEALFNIAKAWGSHNKRAEISNIIQENHPNGMIILGKTNGVGFLLKISVENKRIESTYSMSEIIDKDKALEAFEMLNSDLEDFVMHN